MARPSPTPQLSPQFCFSPSALKDFLRMSRSSIDDPITQHLNALYVSPRAAFDPASTARRSARPPTSQVDANACRDFKDRVLLPSWQARSQVLAYCAAVASSPDPDDPDVAALAVKEATGLDNEVDDRLDPYAGSTLREPRTERLAETVRRERGIENVARTRTWSMVRERCADSVDTWEEALVAWRRKDAGYVRRVERA